MQSLVSNFGNFFCLFNRRPFLCQRSGDAEAELASPGNTVSRVIIRSPPSFLPSFSFFLGK
jgi:hypothetical protein